MKRKVLCLLTSFAASVSAFAATGSLTTSPSPIVSTKSFEITITTDNWGSDVYCYTWAVASDGTEYPATDWASTISSTYKMTGSSGTYTFAVDDIQSFYNLTEAQLETIAKIGFIARTSSAQTDDLFAEVVQGRKNAYSGGEGTQASPFILKTSDDIYALSTTSMDWDAGVYFEMEADITVGQFSGIGTKSSPFQGNFNGNGYSLKGAIVSNDQIGTATGVFNAISGATIQNLGVTNADINGATFTGGLVGYAISGNISRCFSSGSVTGSSICVGGLIGENVGASVTDCYSTASVTNNNDYATGGLVGKNKGTIKNTYASGIVTGYNYAGGLTGANYGSVSASVTMNTSMASTADGSYIARFGGNNNSQNTTSNVLSWKNMPLSEAAWTEYGDHAIDHSANLTALATFDDTLGWDFVNVWEWRTEGTHSFPVLLGLNNQVDPASDAFYNNSTSVDIIDTNSAALSVYPNPVENILNIEAAEGIDNAVIYSLAGRQMNSVDCGNTTIVTIDCSNLAPGAYLLGVTLSDGTRAIEKIIKK